jgi:hypothetical protein
MTSTQQLQLLSSSTASSLARLQQHTAMALKGMHQSAAQLHGSCNTAELQHHSTHALQRLHTYTAYQVGKAQDGYSSSHTTTITVASTFSATSSHRGHAKAGSSTAAAPGSHQPHSSNSPAARGAARGPKQAGAAPTSPPTAAAACKIGNLSVVRRKASEDGTALRKHAASVLADMREDTASAAQGEMAVLLRSFTL